MRTERPLAVYVHIPFCVRKCAYCDFLSFPSDPVRREAKELRGRYFDALLEEIRKIPGEYVRGRGVTSIFFGGGTPSLAESGQIAAVLSALRERFPVSEDAEISIECNPGTATTAKLRELREAGCNRLSIGVQSFSDRELAVLGRIHTRAEAEQCFLDARDAGFRNINLDLMAALPGQDETALLDNVRQAVRLSPEHLSLYSLIIEPGTPFYERYADEVPDPHYDRPLRREGRSLPDEETERAMLHAAQELLADAGYERYEISNYAVRTTDRCRQNLAYWKRREYLGIGLGAASLMEETRFSNTRDLEKYLTCAGDPEREEWEILSEQDRMEEYMFLGLRLTEGIGEADFEALFHREIDRVYGDEIRELVAQGLLVRDHGRIFLSQRGTDLANVVMARFVNS
ncbi:MAG: radical SAM family heme chaperone HemW [Lachnospiraceae bacterium]|nr:radical SAM family heme chaperone HemW [Lachnospiraceae bacterium]